MRNDDDCSDEPAADGGNRDGHIDLDEDVMAVRMILLMILMLTRLTTGRTKQQGPSSIRAMSRYSSTMRIFSSTMNRHVRRSLVTLIDFCLAQRNLKLTAFSIPERPRFCATWRLGTVSK